MSVYCQCGQKLEIIRVYEELNELLVEPCMTCHDQVADETYAEFIAQEKTRKEMKASRRKVNAFRQKIKA